jgi:DNA-binding NtrC family response regulator
MKATPRLAAADALNVRVAAPLLGNSPAVVRLRREIERAAQFSSNVLVTGPSGTGKELVARSLHDAGPRLTEPFIPVDCASLSGELMASQLFGHVAGAFTGANCDALGCFRAAQGGTLFLDEIGELEAPLQAKLLRVLQERTVTPVGSYRSYRATARVVAATNRDLKNEVRHGRFREDLYFRLHVIHLETTPLNQRASDIPLLAEAFLAQLAAEGLPQCRLTPRAVEVLCRSQWPGNIRQLRNLLEQAVIEAETPHISAELLGSLLTDEAVESDSTWKSSETIVDEPAPLPKLAWSTLAEVERAHLLHTLEHTFFNRSAAARLLGITRQALLRKLERYRIESPPRRD